MSIRKHIPNTITCLNLLSGTVSIIFAFRGDFMDAFLFMIIASVFDFCDGFTARMLHAYSDTGKELDSLSDDISFGLAPALILYCYLKGIDGLSPIVRFIPLSIAPFSALRLAKFNLDTRQTTSFLGLPTPACALFIGSMIAFVQTPSGVWLSPALENNFTIPILSIALSLLLISEIPMFSMKIKSKKWSENRARYSFLLCIIPIAAICIIFHLHWTAIPFFLFLLYLLWNCATSLLHRDKK